MLKYHVAENYIGIPVSHMHHLRDGTLEHCPSSNLPQRWFLNRYVKLRISGRDIFFTGTKKVAQQVTRGKT